MTDSEFSNFSDVELVRLFTEGAPESLRTIGLGDMRTVFRLNLPGVFVVSESFNRDPA